MKRVKQVRLVGAVRAARAAGVTYQHLHGVVHGRRPGSKRVKDAIQKYCTIVEVKE